MPGVVFVRASSLDDPDIFHPQMVVYAKHDVKWGSIDPTLPTFEEMATRAGQQGMARQRQKAGGQPADRL